MRQSPVAHRRQRDVLNEAFSWFDAYRGHCSLGLKIRHIGGLAGDTATLETIIHVLHTS